MAGNKVLHETAHLAAERGLLDWNPDDEMAELAPVLRSLIGESFANTVECIGGLLAIQGTHQVLWARIPTSWFVSRNALCWRRVPKPSERLRCSNSPCGPFFQAILTST